MLIKWTVLQNASSRCLSGKFEQRLVLVRVLQKAAALVITQQHFGKCIASHGLLWKQGPSQRQLGAAGDKQSTSHIIQPLFYTKWNKPIIFRFHSGTIIVIFTDTDSKSKGFGSGLEISLKL